MTAIPFWSSDPKTWDTIVLAGAKIPAIVKCKGKKSRKLDVKSPPGSDGATVTDKGYEPAKIDVTLRMHTEEQWIQWQRVSPLVDPKKKGKDRTALTVEHPALAEAGIAKVFIESRGILEVSGGIGTIELGFVEWTRDPVPLGRGSGVISSAKADAALEYAKHGEFKPNDAFLDSQFLPSEHPPPPADEDLRPLKGGDR
jgi:hypothetical protein